MSTNLLTKFVIAIFFIVIGFDVSIKIADINHTKYELQQLIEQKSILKSQLKVFKSPNVGNPNSINANELLTILCGLKYQKYNLDSITINATEVYYYVPKKQLIIK